MEISYELNKQPHCRKANWRKVESPMQQWKLHRTWPIFNRKRESDTSLIRTQEAGRSNRTLCKLRGDCAKGRDYGRKINYLTEGIMIPSTSSIICSEPMFLKAHSLARQLTYPT